MCVHIRISDSRRIVAVSPSATASFSNNGRIGTAFEGPCKESPRTSSSAQHPPHQFHHSHNLPFHSPSPSEEEATLPVWKYSVRLSPWRQIFSNFLLPLPLQHISVLPGAQLWLEFVCLERTRKHFSSCTFPWLLRSSRPHVCVYWWTEIIRRFQLLETKFFVNKKMASWILFLFFYKWTRCGFFFSSRIFQPNNLTGSKQNGHFHLLRANLLLQFFPAQNQKIITQCLPPQAIHFNLQSISQS